MIIQDMYELYQFLYVLIHIVIEQSFAPLDFLGDTLYYK
jgi:hypothetical protein